MLLNNYYNIISAYAVSYPLLKTQNPIYSPTGMLYQTGYTTSLPAKLFDDCSLRKAFTDSGQGVCLGSGATPATREDYALESLIESGLSQLAVSLACNSGPGFVEKVATLTVRNTSEETITIREVGWIGGCYPSGSLKCVLLDRTVIDEPIVIPAGEAKVISYTVRMEFPA